MSMITQTTDFRPYVDSGLLKFWSAYIKEFSPNKIIKLQDDSEITIDIIMYATGYQFSTSYLDPKDGILDTDFENSRGRFLYPMYKRMVAIREPNLTLIGLLTGSPIPLAGVDRQIIFSLCILNKWVKLPSEEEMIEEWDQEIGIQKTIKNSILDKVFKYDYIFLDPQSYAEQVIF